MEKKERKRWAFTPTGIVALGFAGLILLTALLLTLPVSGADGQATPFLDSLFTAVSAVCVTGLVVVDTATHWSLFGQLVLLLAIQIGGLGVMTILGVMALVLGKRLGLRERMLLQESIATLSLSGIVRVVRRAVIGSLIVEGAGAVLLSFRFVPMLGWGRGIFYGIFHSVSAFCNAGFDLMGTVSGPFTSLESFVDDPLVTLTVSALILLGGLGFFVWSDLIGSRFRLRKCALHTKLVLALTVFLVIVPAVLFYLTEARASMSGLSHGARRLASLFAAITPRTAGFDTVATGTLSPAGSLLTILLMLVGGNPGSTAGGAKTTTVMVTFLLALSLLKKQEKLHVFGRSIGSETLLRACAILVVYLALAFSASFLISVLQPELALRDVLLEVFSAENTVGMTAGITRDLNAVSRIILMVLMFSGRLGSMTFAILLTGGRKKSAITYPEDRLLVG